MRKNLKVAAVAVAAALSVAACGKNGPGAGEIIGTAGGAALGGLAGSQFGSGSGQLVATGLGAVIGAGAGNWVGRNVDENMKRKSAETTQSALEGNRTGETSRWTDPDSNARGTVTPTQTFKRGDRYCREYQSTIQVGGETKQGYGTACRQPDGSWEVVSN